MQISPHMETAQSSYTARFDIAPKPADLSKAESPYAPETERPEDQPDGELSGSGAFAEILAGLLRNTGTMEAGMPANAEAEADAVPLADMEVSESDDGEMSVTGIVSKKNQGIGKIAAETGREQADGLAAESGAIETALSETGFSDDEETNLLLGVERLFGHAAEPGAPAVETGEQPRAARAIEGTAELIPEGETLFTELVRPEGGGLAPDTLLEEALSAETLDAEKALSAKTGDNALRRDVVPDTGGEKSAIAAQAAEADFAADKLAAGTDLRKGEKEGKTRLEEARSRDKRRGFSVDVRDFRAGSAQNGGGPKTGELRVLANAEARREGGADPGEITLELRLPNQGQDAPGADTVWEAKAGRAFEDLLSRELHQNFNNDIVRHASMALRDGGEGTIRLALKPESLGNVKIRLEMAENKITGHIVVESEEALRAFEREIHSLEEAFRDSGFDGANLEMSLASDGGGTEQRWQEGSPFMPGQIAASQYDASLEWAETPLAAIDFYQSGPASVNMLA